MGFQGRCPWLISAVPAGRSLAVCGMRRLTTDYRIDADKMSFPSAAIRGIRGYFLRNADCGKTPTEGNEGNEENCGTLRMRNAGAGT
jgi:hypothetical protein